MPTISDAIYSTLRGKGKTGAVNDMLLQWLQDNGATSGNLATAWREMLDTKVAAPTGNNQTDWHYLLGVQGHTGSISDRAVQFWVGGAVLPVSAV
mgnify:CR=1 FL=1